VSLAAPYVLCFAVLYCYNNTQPREFGLLIKQQLYFDRYTRILAPTLDPLRDSRIGLQKAAAATDSNSSAVTAEPVTARAVSGAGPVVTDEVRRVTLSTVLQWFFDGCAQCILESF
jgi:hypothetical protein